MALLTGLPPLPHLTEKGRRGWVDVDKLNEEDPQACSAYAQPIFQYLREAEVRGRHQVGLPGRLHALSNYRVKPVNHQSGA